MKGGEAALRGHQKIWDELGDEVVECKITGYVPGCYVKSDTIPVL
jgi:hypothetical protein